MHKKWYIQGEVFGLTKKKTSHCNSRAVFTRKAPTKNEQKVWKLGHNHEPKNWIYAYLRPEIPSEISSVSNFHSSRLKQLFFLRQTPFIFFLLNPEFVNNPVEKLNIRRGFSIGPQGDIDWLAIQKLLDNKESDSSRECFQSIEGQKSWARFDIPWSLVTHVDIQNVPAPYS